VILLVSAVPEELDFVNSRAGVEVLSAGVGVVDSAARVTQALMKATYDVVIGAGIAGAFPGVARVGDGVVVGDERIDLRIETGEAIVLPGGGSVTEHVRADSHLVDAVVALGFPLVRGITVNEVTATDATARRLREKNVDVETMEGFAVLRAAQLLGVPALEVRGISNIVGDRKNGGWDFGAGIRGLRKVLNATLDLLHTAPSNVD
jgi:futalosine hydrolase